MRKAVAVLIAAAVPALGAQAPDLDDVLERAATYVATYQLQLRGLVAEESYAQNVTTNLLARNTPTVRSRMNREGRQLRSDLLLVKLGDDD